MGRQFSLLVLFLAVSLSAFSADKLIALTFDDGPRPYVLFGDKLKGTPGLLDVLDKQNVKATFFVMGWRLTPKTWGDKRYETNVGINCIDAAHEVLKRGHEIENHTYSHVELKTAERKKGEGWVISDVDQGAKMVQAITGSKPEYLRPPDWILPDDARRDLEHRGYRVLTISNENPPAMRDINSLDYLCAGAHPTQCPRAGLAANFLSQIETREKHGIFTHIVAFHELTTTTAAMPQIIASLKAKGYRFVTVKEYMHAVGGSNLKHASLKDGVRSTGD
jgi:peptidoglycan/xylan/chitin deacetylase (PgdA/CDA1 family)